MPERTDDPLAGINALLVRLVALDLRLEAVELWQKRYGPIVDNLEDKAMIAAAVAEMASKALTNRWTKRHYAVALAALFVPALVSALTVVLVGHVAGG